VPVQPRKNVDDTFTPLPYVISTHSHFFFSFDEKVTIENSFSDKTVLSEKLKYRNAEIQKCMLFTSSVVHLEKIFSFIGENKISLSQN